MCHLSNCKLHPILNTSDVANRVASSLLVYRIPQVELAGYVLDYIGRFDECLPETPPVLICHAVGCLRAAFMASASVQGSADPY